MLSEALNLEIWDRLIQDKPLDGLVLDTRDGRIDIRGLELPEPKVLRRFQFKGRSMAEIESGAIIQGAKWRNLDFSGSKLSGLRLMLSHIEDCRFDGCELLGVRIWATALRDSSFRGANLRGSVLGGVLDGVRNTFVGIDFSEANLSGTIYEAAAFERCLFCNTKLAKIDFQTGTFADCRFEAELDDVLFYRHGFKGERFPPNEMVNVDFTGARLKHVGFRGLMLDRVRLPVDEDHLVLKNFASTLDQMSATFERQGDALAKKLAVFIGSRRKWAMPDQVQGVIYLQDLADVVGEEGVQRFLAAVPNGARNRA